MGTFGYIMANIENFPDQFLVSNGDSIFSSALCLNNIDPKNNYIFTRKETGRNRYDWLNARAGKVTEILHRSEMDKGYINAGVYIFHKSTIMKFKRLTSKTNVSLETDFLPFVVKHKLLSQKLATGKFIDIGIPADYKNAPKYIEGRHLGVVLDAELFLNVVPDSIKDVMRFLREARKTNEINIALHFKYQNTQKIHQETPFTSIQTMIWNEWGIWTELIPFDVIETDKSNSSEKALSHFANTKCGSPENTVFISIDPAANEMARRQNIQLLTDVIEPSNRFSPSEAFEKFLAK